MTWCPQHALWVLALCLLVAKVVIALASPSLADLMQTLARINVIQLGAIVLLAHQSLRLESTGALSDARWRHGGYLLLTAALSWVSAPLMMAALFVCWGLEWSLHAFDAPLRWRTGILALALAFNMLAAPAIFKALGEQILQLDALIVYGLSSWFDPALVLQGTALRRANGFGVVLVGACSAFNSLSLASLAYVAYVVFRDRTPNRLDYGWLLVMSLLMVGFNAVRIELSSISREAYEFWHNDAQGQGLMSLALHALMLAGCVVGDRLCKR